MRDWIELATQHVIAYARAHARFTGQECIAAAEIPPPADPRAWGNPFRAVAKSGAIARAGSVIHKRRGSPVPLWESRIIEQEKAA